MLQKAASCLPLPCHSSILACEIPWTEKPGGLQYLGLQWVRQDWANKHSTEPLPAPQQSLWGVDGGISQFWEPSSTFGDQKWLRSVPFMVYWYVKRCFHFRGRSRFLIQSISLRVLVLSHSVVSDSLWLHELLGEAHWLKPPTLARHHSNHLHELFYNRRS